MNGKRVCYANIDNIDEPGQLHSFIRTFAARTHLGSIVISPESKFQEVSNFGLPYMILARRSDTLFDRYILEVYKTGGCIKFMLAKVIKMDPPFKMTTEMLMNRDLSN